VGGYTHLCQRGRICVIMYLYITHSFRRRYDERSELQSRIKAHPPFDFLTLSSYRCPYLSAQQAGMATATGCCVLEAADKGRRAQSAAYSRHLLLFAITLWKIEPLLPLIYSRHQDKLRSTAKNIQFESDPIICFVLSYLGI
jgi:hypothetical protein